MCSIKTKLNFEIVTRFLKLRFIPGNLIALLRHFSSSFAAMYLQNRGPKSTHMRYLFFALFTTLLIFVFGFCEKTSIKIAPENEVITDNPIGKKSVKKDTIRNVETATQASDFVSYAKTLTGTPYLYGSVNPEKGLDCSGFINAVSNHFGIKVPRSSVEFTNFGTTVETSNAKPGDLILFTGTDPGKRIVGHMGIIINNLNGEVEFIHSSSGNAKGVIVSDLSGYYETRLVKIIRIFPTAANEVAV